MHAIRRRRTHEDKRLYAARDIDCEKEDKGKKRSLKKATAEKFILRQSRSSP